MFQLYKQRNFSSLINDTFTFFKVYGKSFLKNYFIVNGGFLLVLLLLMYFVGNIFLETLFSNISNPGGSEQVIEEYFNSNSGLFITVAVVSGVILLILTLLSYSYPVLFMKFLERGIVPNTKDIFNALGKNAGKIIAFSFLWLVTFLPIAIIVVLLSMLLIVIIIGIPIAIIAFAAMSSWMYLAFYDYLNNNSSYFEAMKNGWNILFQNFWHHVGSTAIVYLIISVIHSIISFIPYFIGIFGLITDTATGEVPDTESFSFLALMMIITFMLSTLFGYVLGNLLFVNQGLIYYSGREEKENQSLHSEIDLIGRDSE